MGVHGLWKLLESTGKPVNPETLEGKILAVDISIWLNQAVKGVRDRDGNSVQNAHLLTLFHRLCKLLFFRIKPIFVYDGDAPLLKKQTLAIRRQRKEEMAHESKQTNEKLLRTFLKRQAIKAALGDRSQETVPSISSVQRDAEDMYVLPALPPVEEKERNSSDEEENRDVDEMPEAYLRFQEEFYDNPNSVDINSQEFSLLSPEIKHEILKEMKEFTKRRRTLHHTPPERSGDFSQYQLAGLLQRNNLNQRLEGVEKEMSQRSYGTVEEQYSQGGEHSFEARRLISEDSSHYILIKGPQKTVKAPESQPAATPWSSGPWSRRGRPKGRPEPLWRPVSDDILEGNDPSSSSSSSSTTPKPALSVEKQSLDGAPPSPRTLQAIQAAMMDTSSDEDEGVSKKTVQGSRMTSSQDDNGAVSPRTLEAIQRAMMEDDTAYKKDQTPQRKYVIITSSEDEDGEESKMSTLPEAQEEHGGGVSPQTLLAIQRSLGESGTKQKEQQDHSTSSEGEEMEKVVGMRSKAFRSAVLTEGEECRQDKKKSSVADARSTVFPFSDESGEEIKPKSHHHASLQGQEETLEESDLPEKVFPQKGSLETGTDQASSNFHTEKQRQERKGQITVKSEEEDSSSEEDFIEVSEGEEVSELNDSVTRADELLTSQTTQLDVNKTEEDVEISNEGADSSDISLHLSLNQTEMERQQTSQEATTVPASTEWDNIDTEELEQLERDLQAEQSSLQEQQQQQQRSAATVTGQMCQESQELLRLFGVPFLVAPMEAEAQCAALDRTDQTHGTITDDSDIWLFGGRHVYKNFFSSNKYVEHYQYVDIQNQLGLDRTKMINLAYLLGSDYTEGIPGVGYVTGMEILNEFPGSGLEPLTEFSEWWSEAQKNKKLVTNPKDTKVKKKLRNLTVHAGFPNPAVAQAYLQPSVEHRFGWNSKKTEETLQPVLKQLNTQQTQLRIDSFFRLEQQEKQAIRSQRLRRAVTCLKRKEREGEGKEEESGEDENQVSPVKMGKKEKAKEGGTDITPAGVFGGGFIGSDVYTDILEDKIRDEQPVQEEKQPSKPSQVESVSRSSSSEDEYENSYGAAMVTARSVFEAKPRGRGRRGGRGI
ncbi:hypothetical protein MHYP_G00095240 [Metynnis hypsauchen]